MIELGDLSEDSGFKLCLCGLKCGGLDWDCFECTAREASEMEVEGCCEIEME
jgi:hypothetical protein